MHTSARRPPQHITHTERLSWDKRSGERVESEMEFVKSSVVGLFNVMAIVVVVDAGSLWVFVCARCPCPWKFILFVVLAMNVTDSPRCQWKKTCRYEAWWSKGREKCEKRESSHTRREREWEKEMRNNMAAMPSGYPIYAVTEYVNFLSFFRPEEKERMFFFREFIWKWAWLLARVAIYSPYRSVLDMCAIVGIISHICRSALALSLSLAEIKSLVEIHCWYAQCIVLYTHRHRLAWDREKEKDGWMTMAIEKCKIGTIRDTPRHTR